MDVAAGKVIRPQSGQRGEQIIVVQLRFAEFQAPFEVGCGLGARGTFCRGGEEAASQP